MRGGLHSLNPYGQIPQLCIPSSLKSRCACRDAAAKFRSAAPRLRVDLDTACHRHYSLLFAALEQTHAPGSPSVIRSDSDICTITSFLKEKTLKPVSPSPRLVGEGRNVRKRRELMYVDVPSFCCAPQARVCLGSVVPFSSTPGTSAICLVQ